MRIKTSFFISLSLLLFSCDKNEKADAYGNIEATEHLVSSENKGRIEQLDVEEGDLLNKDQKVGYIDTVPLSLKKQKLKAKRNIIRSRSNDVLSELEVLDAQLETLLIKRKRLQKMIQDKAATQQQLDDINGKINTLESRKKSIRTKNSAVLNELDMVKVEILEIEDLIDKSLINNPIKGKVLTKYRERSEIVGYGQPLYKVADLKHLEVRAYISETQLSQVRLGQEVVVKVDDGDKLAEHMGTLSWISSKAEFTPKIVQTKEERKALVYAIKVKVKNDGSLKIGMPAEVWFRSK